MATSVLFGLGAASQAAMPLDAEGRGRVIDAHGIVIEVDRVDVDGSAQVSLISGVTPGETLLFPALTRESIVAMLQEMKDRLSRRARPAP